MLLGHAHLVRVGVRVRVRGWVRVRVRVRAPNPDPNPNPATSCGAKAWWGGSVQLSATMSRAAEHAPTGQA